MAKFFVTNDELVFNRVIDSNKQVFVKNRVDYLEKCKIVSYAKINNVSKVYNPQNTIWAVGSFIYKGTIGEDALDKIYNDFEELGVAGLKKQIIGYYNIAICHKGTFYFFNDYYGVYDLCYYYDSKYFAIGSQLKDLAYSTGKLEIDEFSFIQEVCQLGAFPGKTFYRDIHKMKGNEFARVSDNVFYIESIPEDIYKISYNYQSEKDALNDISQLISESASIISKAYGKIVVFLTGGLDSRLNFAAYYNRDNKLRTQYWKSFGVNKEDEIIAQKISSYYGVPFKASNCYDPEDINGINWNYQNSLFKIVGFYNFVCNGNSQIINEIRKYANDGEFLAFGYFCEAIRLREWAAALNSDTFSLDRYIDDYYINKTLNHSNYPNISGYRDYLKTNYIEQLKSIGINDNYDRIPIRVFERFRWIMARLCDSRMECINNYFSYSFAIMSIPHIHEAVLSLPETIIRDGVFQVKLIDALNQGMVRKFEVFSHNRAYVINKYGNKKRQFTFKNVADRVFMLLPFIKPLCISIFRRHRNQKINIGDNYNQTMALFAKCNMPFDFYIDKYRHNSNDTSIKRYRQFLVGVGILQEASETQNVNN